MNDDETEKHWEADLLAKSIGNAALIEIANHLAALKLAVFALVPHSERGDLLDAWEHLKAQQEKELECLKNSTPSFPRSPPVYPPRQGPSESS